MKAKAMAWLLTWFMIAQSTLILYHTEAFVKTESACTVAHDCSHLYTRRMLKNFNQGGQRTSKSSKLDKFWFQEGQNQVNVLDLWNPRGGGKYPPPPLLPYCASTIYPSKCWICGLKHSPAILLWLCFMLYVTRIDDNYLISTQLCRVLLDFSWQYFCCPLWHQQNWRCMMILAVCDKLHHTNWSM